LGIISWIIMGLIAGAIAKFLMPGDDPGGIFLTIILGIVGAVVGGFIASTLGLGGLDGFSLGTLIIAILGSILLLIVYRMTVGRRAT
jgi:uncharacterized membrane protein YeaQ/YmgE (transglycosylase-associated protein family)